MPVGPAAEATKLSKGDHAGMRREHLHVSHLVRELTLLQLILVESTLLQQMLM
jgi:hypothetical protein